MADDFLGGVLEGDDDESEASAAGAPAGPDAFAAAVAARLSANDPEVARDTSAFLKAQKDLVELQAEHLRDEHASRLRHLHLSVAAAKRKRYADRMRNALYTCIALIVLGVLIGAVRMTAEAMSDHSLVVDDFTVPADFAARGVTSRGLAEDLASRVATIRDTVNRESITHSNEVRADQASILKVQIPETGISVDELERFMHRWLGHQTVLNGELRNEAGGQISVVLHIAGANLIVERGSSTDLDRLMQTIAEKAFAVFDPVNDVIYLGGAGRRAEAYDAAVRYARSPEASASTSAAAEAYSLLAESDTDRRRALSRALIATDIDTHILVVWFQAASNSTELGHYQAALDFYRKSLGTKKEDQPLSQQEAYPRLITSIHATIDQATGNFAALEDDYKADKAHLLFGGRAQQVDRYAQSAVIAAALHDVARSQEQLARAQAAETDVPPLSAQWTVNSDAGDWVQALAAAKTLVADAEAQKSRSPEQASRVDLPLQTLYRPWLAYSEAMTGDTASATELISQTPTDCYLCVRIRALVAAAAGDAAGADRWFAEAVRQGPDLPMAYLEWGQTLLTRGDLAGATREFALAHEKGPHFSDPLKGWGDVLVKQGEPKEALARYDEALRYAPNWAALKQARNAAAAMTEHRT